MLKNKPPLTFNEMFPHNSAFWGGRSFFYPLFQSLGTTVFYTMFTRLFGDSNDFYKSLAFRFYAKNGNRTINVNVLNLPQISEIATDLIFKTEAQQNVFFSTFFVSYRYKWSKLLQNVYAQEYNPIENYNRTEEQTFAKTGEETESRVDTRSIKTDTVNSENVTGSNSTETTGSGTADNFINGFNSSQSVSSDNSKSSNVENASSSSQSTNNQNGNSNTNDELTSAVNRSFTNRVDTTQATVKGNIGVTTSQQMLESEIALRLKNDFIDIIFKDIENELFSAIF